MNIESPKRAYRQSARAAAAEATGERILDAFVGLLQRRWFEEIRLEDVARDAGVTVQTVLRRFGSKEGLLGAMHRRMDEQIRRRRGVAPGDVTGVIDALIEDYESIGDLTIRLLAQEDRYPALKAVTDEGRAGHRAWMANAFAPWLESLAAERGRRATDALVAAGDVYVWKLLRRDMVRPVAEYRALVERMCAAAIEVSREEMFGKSRSRTT
jgi:AcrR family transcriptional regulator